MGDEAGDLSGQLVTSSKSCRVTLLTDLRGLRTYLLLTLAAPASLPTYYLLLTHYLGSPGLLECLGALDERAARLHEVVEDDTVPPRCLVRDRVGVRGRGRGRGRVRVPPRCLAVLDDNLARIAVAHLGQG